MSLPTGSESSGTSLFVNFEEDVNVLIARLVGPNIGQREAEIITEAMTKTLAHAVDATVMHVDMTEVTFMNSMGIGMLVDLRGKTSSRKMKLILGGVKPELEQLLKMVRLDKLFKICTTDAELAKALKRR
ncbi:MAG: hypothetical protein CMJ39_12375 [Phycisphaerae bacterium]|nr:hypothetical protein [Phycisphaerae bacterium]